MCLVIIAHMEMYGAGTGAGASLRGCHNLRNRNRHCRMIIIGQAGTVRGNHQAG